MALHGREAELQAIESALDGARAGDFRALAIAGEAGIGKTALLDAAIAGAEERGMLVVNGRAAEHERTVPFALVVDALDDQAVRVAGPRLAAAGAELGAVLPSAADEATPALENTGPGERFRYHRALRAFVELLGRERPVAVVLDDLQWADDASLEWVLHVLRRPPRAPGVMLLATRPSDAATRLLQAIGSAGEHLVLEPLGTDAAAAALNDIGQVANRGLADRITREAGGNPLFLRELARAAQRSREGLPATIAAGVQREVDALDAETRSVLDGAAVAGDPFGPELAAAAAGVAMSDGLAALDGLVAAGLVRAGDGATFSFRHPLVHRAVYDVVPPGWRLAAHERVARVLAHRGAAPSLRAYHVERFARPGDEEARRLLETAAAQDLSSSPTTSARWYRAALGLLPDAATEQRAALLPRFGDALAAAGRLAEALDAYDRAIALGAADGDIVAQAARIERQLGRHAAARRRLMAALDTARDDERAALDFELGTVAYQLGDIESMVRHARSAAGHSPRDDEGARASVEAVEAFAALWSGQPGRALIESAEHRAMGLPDDGRFEPLAAVGELSFSFERFAPSALLLDRAVSAALRARRDQPLPQLRGTLALARLFDLDPRGAAEAAEASAEGARLQQSPAQVALATGVRGIALDLLGRAVESVAAAEESQELFARCERTIYTMVGSALNLILIHEHDPERLLAEALPLLAEGDELIGRPTSVLRPIVSAALTLGRREVAEHWTGLIAARVEATGGLPAGRVRVECARAELLLGAGDTAGAVRTAAGAVALAEAETLRQDAARARIVHGRALIEAGDRDAAVAELERAIVDSARGGAERLASEAARELRRAGTRVSASVWRASGAGRDELSERERSIAELVAEGRSNKEVAATLFISGKTVENNLSRIYAKLGVRSRTELARAFRGS